MLEMMRNNDYDIWRLHCHDENFQHQRLLEVNILTVII